MLPVPKVRGGWRRLTNASTGSLSSRHRYPARIGESPAKTNAERAEYRLSSHRPLRRTSLMPVLHCVRRRRVLSSHRDFIWSVSMQIEERAVGDVVVLDLKGKVTLGEGDELLKDKVNSLVNQGHKKIVLNLADVPYIDSAGLGEVVRTYTTVSRQGGSLKLLNLTKRITDLLSITKLLTVFETFDSENEAVRSFSASAKV
jgi:anti-sigma B factor antagonist